MEDPTFLNVTDAIGLEIYSFLHPRDLFRLSRTTHRIFDGIGKQLIQVALRQLSPILDDRIEYQITVSNDHSFPSREHLLSHVLQKVEVAELKFSGQTMEESLIHAQQVLNREKKPGVYGATMITESYDLFPDPEYAHVGYNYQKENRELAAIRAKDILKRMSSMGQMSIVKGWMDYFFAQNSLVIGSWFWSCRHRNLDFQGVEGKGIMFSFPESPKEKLEMECRIMTRTRVGRDEEEVAPIIPQFAVATRVEPINGEDETATQNQLLACLPLMAEVVIGEDDVYAVHVKEEEELLVAGEAVLLFRSESTLESDADGDSRST